MFKKICSYSLDLICGLMFLLSLVCFYTALTRPFNSKMQLYFGSVGYGKVISGSMEPTLNVGDVVTIVRTKNIEVGDICLYYDETKEINIIHRVIEIVDLGEEKYYMFQGDNKETNPLPDDLVKEKNIIGKVKRVNKGFNIDYIILANSVTFLISSLYFAKKLSNKKIKRKINICFVFYLTRFFIKL